MNREQRPDAGIPADLREIERTALELAQLAGAEIITALGTAITVRYKTGSDDAMALRDPVSEIDHNVETLIRSRLAEKFPDHDIIGEEIIERRGTNDDFVWAIDPIDGTTNFVNGFPIFGASIGVIYRGAPVVGAIWSSFTHALKPGVYHARRDAPLCYDGAPIDTKTNPMVRRRLAGSSVIGADRSRWDYRKTGSAAVECALVAIGALEVARFAAPNIWDVAGGVVLVRSAGGTALSRHHGEWSPMSVFEPAPVGEEGVEDLAHWRRALIVGAAESAEAMQLLERS